MRHKSWVCGECSPVIEGGVSLPKALTTVFMTHWACALELRLMSYSI